GDGGRNRLQPRHITVAVAAPGDATGLHAFPPDPGGSVARCHRPRRPRTRAGRPRHAQGGRTCRFRAVADQTPVGTGLLAGWGPRAGYIRRWPVPGLTPTDRRLRRRHLVLSVSGVTTPVDFPSASRNSIDAAP